MAVYRSIIGVASCFGVFTLWLYFLTRQFEKHNSDIYFPKDFKDLKIVSSALKETQKDHYGLVILWFCSAYMYKQTFAIPGSVFTNILAGAIFGTTSALPLVCFLSATGATCCFLLSKFFGRQLVLQKFPDRILAMQRKVNESENSLFYFLLSARLFPATPNWFLNLSSPIIGVPIVPFYFSVLLGLIPYNFICVHTGEVLSSISSMDDVFSYSTFFGMLLVAAVAILPGIIIRRRRNTEHEKV